MSTSRSDRVRDVQIPDGEFSSRAVRRECAECNRFAGWLAITLMPVDLLNPARSDSSCAINPGRVNSSCLLRGRFKFCVSRAVMLVNFTPGSSHQFDVPEYSRLLFLAPSVALSRAKCINLRTLIPSSVPGPPER
ncbi:hypothetical protein R1flu_020454 [Riccia fluitans]|uniref:Uncharacterized protein n=1 Tax=Riccia fluitans TaxID=41844 RepID=A0ABD1ZNP7_9MARC